MYKLYLIVIFILLLSEECLKSQTCFSFHNDKHCANKPKNEFRIYGQSESAMLEKDHTVELPVIFYGNKDYIVTVCTEKGYYPVHYVIRDIETNNIFYDNMEDDYYESVGFTVDVPRKVVLEITLLAENIELSNFGDPQACVGVNILWRRAEKIGFRK